MMEIKLRLDEGFSVRKDEKNKHFQRQILEKEGNRTVAN